MRLHDLSLRGRLAEHNGYESATGGGMHACVHAHIAVEHSNSPQRLRECSREGSMSMQSMYTYMRGYQVRANL